MCFRTILKVLLGIRHLGFMLLNSWFSDSRCQCCGTVSSAIVCRSCAEKYIFSAVRSDAGRCSVCGGFLAGESGVCMSCRRNRILQSADKILAVMPYRLWGKNLMFEWKMNEMRSLSYLFAKAAAIGLRCHFANMTGDFAVVPVPPRPGKIRKKGWDQIQEICLYLEVFYGYRVLHLLERLTREQQKKLDLEHRLENKGKSYVLSKNGALLKKEDKLPSNVILLDDVVTTGVTVETCCHVLKSAGIRKVGVLALFKVD